MCFGYDDHLLFATCFWQKKREPNIFYFVYRILIAIYFALTFGMAFDGLEREKRRIFMNNTVTLRCDVALIYIGHLTRGTFVYILLQALLALILISISVGYYLKKKEIFNFEAKCAKVLCVFYWIYNIIATDFIIVQQCFFWAWYYKSFKTYNLIQKDGGNVGKHFFVYGSNIIFILIDFFMVAHPVNGSHCWVPFVIGHMPITIVFLGVFFGTDFRTCAEASIVSAVYELLGPAMGALASIGFFLISTVFFVIFNIASGINVVLAHLCFWGFYKLKLCLGSPPKSNSSDADASADAS